MARSNDRDRSTRRAPKDNGRRTKKKVCIFCKDNISYVDYKDVNLLRKFMSDRGKIRARRVSGNCAQHQRAVAVAIKTSRELAMLPYTQRTTTERPGGRGGGRGGREGGRGGGAPFPRSGGSPAGASAGDLAAAGADAGELVSVADAGVEEIGASE